MEHTGSIPPFGISAADLPDVAGLFDKPGPFVTVYLTTEADVENAAQRSELRWKALRSQLTDAGAPEEALVAIDPLVPDAHLDGETLAAVATAEGLLFSRHEDEPPSRDLGRVAPLPSVGPLVEWAQLDLPHIVVLTDRSGADIVTFGPGDEGSVAEVGSGDSDDPELRKSGGGGWRHRRNQERAENLWEANAKDVADAVAKATERSGARIVIVAGDVRARQLLRDSLPEQVGALVRELDGARGADGDLDDLADDVVRLVATVAAEDTMAMLRTFRQEQGQGDRATAGVTATVTALTRSQVGALLLHDDPDDERTAWFGPGPGEVAGDAETLRSLGVDDPVQGRLVDVLIRAAWGTGAAVHVLPSASSVPEGVASILRFST